MGSDRYSVNGERLEDETLKIALAAYENARMDGLCHDGAWECALTAVSSPNPENNPQWMAQFKQQLQESLLC